MFPAGTIFKIFALFLFPDALGLNPVSASTVRPVSTSFTSLFPSRVSLMYLNGSSARDYPSVAFSDKMVTRSLD